MTKRLFFAILATLLLACSVQAQPRLQMLGAGGTPAGAAPGYTGPGDLSGWTTPYAFYSVFGMTGAIAATGTQKAMTIRSLSGAGGTQDLVILTTGLIDMATANTFAGVDATGTGAITGTTLTFTGGHIGDIVTGGTTAAGTYIVSGSSPTWTVNISQTVVSATLTLTWGVYITKLWDQSGNGRDIAQGTSGNQGQLMIGPGGKPSIRCFGLNATYYRLDGLSNQAAPVTYATVTERTAIDGTTNGLPIASFVGAGSFVYFNGTVADKIGIYGGGAGGMDTSNSPADNVAHAVIGVINNTSSVINVDGTETALGTAIGTGGFSTGIQVGGDPNLTLYVNGFVSEALFRVGGASSGERSALITNMQSRFGI